MSSVQKIFLAFAILILFNLLLVIVFGDDGLVDLYLYNNRKADIENKNEVLTQENLALYREIDRLKHDPEFIENVARKELGMIGSGEVILKLKPKAKAPPNERKR